MSASLNLPDYLNTLEDKRRTAGQRHKLTIAIMSIMSNYIGYRAIGNFIERNKAALRLVWTHCTAKKNKIHYQKSVADN